MDIYWYSCVHRAEGRERGGGIGPGSSQLGVPIALLEEIDMQVDKCDFYGSWQDCVCVCAQLIM